MTSFYSRLIVVSAQGRAISLIMIEHDVVALDAVSIAHDGSTTMEG